MSRRALLIAVRDSIRKALELDRRTCEITDMSGKPPPSCGQRFIGVHRAGRQAKIALSAIDEMYGVGVTVTMRVKEPYDRIGTNLLEQAETGMDDLCDQVRMVVSKDLHDNRIINAANAVLAIDESVASNPRGFKEPLFFTDDNDIRYVGADWMSTEPGSGEIQGLACTLKFFGARRIQPLAFTVDQVI